MRTNGKDALPDGKNLPAGDVDWDGLSDFIVEMLDPKCRGRKGWKTLDEPEALQALPESAVQVLQQLREDLHEGFYRQRGDRA